MDHRFVSGLTDASALLAQQQSLEEGLRDLARRAAISLGAGRCSVMLVVEREDDPQPGLQVLSHWGDLPDEAYSQVLPLDQGIAGYVARTAQALLIEDINESRFANLARPNQSASPGLMSAPIQFTDSVIGVINVSAPLDRCCFREKDLDLLRVYSLVIGQTIHIFQLQKLAESRILQMAELLAQREKQTPKPRQIHPNPGSLSRMVAKNLYRELSQAGFGPNAIISVASEVIAQLSTHIGKHRTRLEREQSRKDPAK